MFQQYNSSNRHSIRSSTKLNDAMQTILVTGGTGLVGTHLSALLTEKGFRVTHLSRSNKPEALYQTYTWDIASGEIEQEAIATADYIVHLAGAGVADKRWSDSWKKAIYNSRIKSTKLLREKVAKWNPSLKKFISASAIGFYGEDTKEELMNEEAHRGEGFLADVVVDWEREIEKFAEVGVSYSAVRVGIVLDKNHGALPKMAQPIKMGVGAPLASGSQYMSWIHVEDLCRIFAFAIDHDMHGVVNGVAPQPVTNKVFTEKIADILDKPIWLPNVPKFALKLMVGEMADILAGGTKVSSAKIEREGFKFAYPTLEKSLQNLLI